MTPHSFSLEPFTISDDTGSNTSVILSPIISVDLPDMFEPINDIDDLKRVVQSGELWIARRGACRFYFTVVVEDSTSNVPDIVVASLGEHVATLLENLEVGLIDPSAYTHNNTGI